eukprot:37040_1
MDKALFETVSNSLDAYVELNNHSVKIWELSAVTALAEMKGVGVAREKFWMWDDDHDISEMVYNDKYDSGINYADVIRHLSEMRPAVVSGHRSALSDIRSLRDVPKSQIIWTLFHITNKERELELICIEEIGFMLPWCSKDQMRALLAICFSQFR